MLQFLLLYSKVSKKNIQGTLNGRISPNIIYGKLVITRFVSAGIKYMRKRSSELNFRINYLCLSFLHRLSKRLPKMLFELFIRHGSRAGNIWSKIISAADKVYFGDAPEWLMISVTQGSFGWWVSETVKNKSSWRKYIPSMSWVLNFNFPSMHWF